MLVLVGKLFVGLSTGSMAILADAVHSFTDMTNNIIAWVDRACALGVALLIIYLAINLFRRAVPTLIDEYAIAPEGIVKLFSFY